MTESTRHPVPMMTYTGRPKASRRVGAVFVGGCGLLVMACGGQMADGDDALPMASGGTNTTTAWSQGGNGTQLGSSSSSIFPTYGATGAGPSTNVRGGASSTYGSTGWAAGGATWASSGNGGATNCHDVDCAPIPANCRAVEYSDRSCCPVCTLQCGLCGLISCMPGYHQETPDGACCATCVPDVTSACDSGRQEYAAYREILIANYGSFSCKTSSDCATIYERNRCAAGCGVAVPSRMQATIVTNIEQIAESLCGSCSYPVSPPCPMAQAACMNGLCGMSTLLL